MEKEGGPNVNDWETVFRVSHGVQVPCYLGGGGGHAERQP